MSVSTENFIKTIFHLQQSEGFDTRPGSVARALGVSNAAATDMARKMADKKLIVYEKYKALALTEEGSRMALDVIRRHRLWETFLFRTFRMSLYEIHREAEMLEHQTSDFMTEILYNYLGKPETDPHGDPIPRKDSIVPENPGYHSMNLAEPGQAYEVARLQSSDEEFYDFCTAKGLEIGSEIFIVNRYAKSKMTEITVKEMNLLLNDDFTRNVFVKPIFSNP